MLGDMQPPASRPDYLWRSPSVGRPRDWIARGIYIPLENARLDCTRLRWLPSGEADVILAPQQFGGSFYVIPLKYFAAHAKFSAADTAILHLIEKKRPANPIEMRRLAAGVLAEIQAIPDPSVARKRACQMRAMTALSTAVGSATSRRGESSPDRRPAMQARIEESPVGSAAHLDRNREPEPSAMPLAGIAGLDDANFVARLDQWVEALQAVEPDQVAKLANFNSHLAAWIPATKWSDVASFRPLMAQIRTVLEKSTAHLAFFAHFEADPLSELASDRHDEASARAAQLAWLLDGWSHAFAVLDRAIANSVAIETVAPEIARLIPLLPEDLETTRNDAVGLGPMSAAELATKTKSERTVVSVMKTVRAGQDWLTGLPESDARRLAAARRTSNLIPETAK